MPLELENFLTHLKIDKISTTQESFGEINKKKRPMPGEESHIAQSLQLFTKEELSQTDILSTTETLRPPFTIPTPLLRPPDKLLSTPKRLLMPGERELLQTLDQFSL
jgi:hypothetical protein